MGLITPAGIPTEKLVGLAKTTGDGYNKVLRGVLVDSYPFLFKGLDLRRATIQEIEERFASAGASGDTLRKCVVFFLSAAKVVEIQMSPFITAPRRTKRQQGTTLRSERLRKPVRDARHRRATGKSPSLLVPELPEFDPTWPNEIKALWFEAFRELVKRDS
jgi:hypothetical protein